VFGYHHTQETPLIRRGLPLSYLQSFLYFCDSFMTIANNTSEGFLENLFANTIFVSLDFLLDRGSSLCIAFPDIWLPVVQPLSLNL